MDEVISMHYEISYFDDELIEPFRVLWYQLAFDLYFPTKHDFETGWLAELCASSDRVIGHYSLIDCFEISQVKF
jgi:hypothetical protein